MSQWKTEIPKSICLSYTLLVVAAYLKYFLFFVTNM